MKNKKIFATSLIYFSVKGNSLKMFGLMHKLIEIRKAKYEFFNNHFERFDLLTQREKDNY